MHETTGCPISVADFVKFLTFRRRLPFFTPTLTEDEVAKLYADAAVEDRELAEAGLKDWQAAFLKEDLA